MPSHNLGAEHQRERAAQIAAMANDGTDLCCRCGRSMFASPRIAVDRGAHPQLGVLDLDDWPGRVFGGPQIKRLAHRRCNRQAGARLGNRLRGIRKAAGLPSGKPAARPRW